MNKLISCLVENIADINSEFTDLELKKMEYGLTCFFDEVTKIVLYFICFHFNNTT